MIWLLDLDFGGRIFRFAERAVAVSTQASASYRYSAGLALGDLPASESQAAVQILAGVDWAELAARGVDLEAGTATLRRWTPGAVLEAAAVRLVGRVSEPEWGAPAEGLELTILAEPWLDRAVIPAAASRVCAETWPVDTAYELPETARDAAYPIVVGYPGRAGFDALGVLLRSGSAICGSPGYLVEYNSGAAYNDLSKLLIAGHEVRAAAVWVFDLSAQRAEERAVQHTTDLLGQKVAYIDFTGTLLPCFPDHEYWIAWAPDDAGASYNADRSGVLRGAGEVIAFLYSAALARISGGVRPGVRADAGRMAAQRAYLDRFKLDFCIGSPTTVDEWIRANLAPILPIRWVEGRGGGYWCAWRYDAQARDAVASLSADRGQVRRVSRLRVPGGERYTRFRLDYGRIAEGRYGRRRILTGEPDPDDARARTSWRCQIARAREARRTGGDGVVELLIQSDAIQDDATADLILDALAARYATPPTPIAYEGGPELETLEIGDVVTVTDVELYLSERVALVADVVPGEVVTVTLELLSGPGQTRRRTA